MVRGTLLIRPHACTICWLDQQGQKSFVVHSHLASPLSLLLFLFRFFFVVSLIKNTLLMLSQHLPMMILLWRVAAVQPEEQYDSEHCNSKSSCFTKSDSVLRNFCILYYIILNWTTSIAMDDSIRLFALLLLLLCGDVETNPGPGK